MEIIIFGSNMSYIEFRTHETPADLLNLWVIYKSGLFKTLSQEVKDKIA